MTKLTNEQKAAIARGYTNGTALAVLATGHDTSVKVVREVLKEQGISVRPREPKAWMRTWG